MTNRTLHKDERVTDGYQISAFIPMDVYDALCASASENERTLSAEIRIALRKHAKLSA